MTQNNSKNTESNEHSKQSPLTERYGRSDTNAGDAEKINRRELLAALGVTAGSSSLAGCSGVSDIIETAGEGAEEAIREFGPFPRAGLTSEMVKQLGAPEPETNDYTIEERRTAANDKEYFVKEHNVLTTYGTASEVRYPMCVLSMPRSGIAGAPTNPYPDGDIGSFLWGEHGRHIFRALGMGISAYDRGGTATNLAPDDWIDLMDGGNRDTLEAAKMTLLADDGTGYQLCFTFSSNRIERDVPEAEESFRYGYVLLGAAVLTKTPVPDAMQERMYDFIHRAAPEVVLDPPTPAPDYEMGIEDPRLVQTVEDTAVEGAGLELPDPPLVTEQNVAPVFTLDNSGDVPWYVRTRIQSKGGPIAKENKKQANPVGGGVAYDPTYTTALDIKSWAIEAIGDQNGDAPAIFDQEARVSSWTELSSTGPWNLELPVFELTTDHTELSIELMTPMGLPLDETTVEKGADFETVDSQRLRVGFIPIDDPGNGRNYGAGSHGFPPTYESTVNAAVEYLSRALPGGIIAYRHDTAFQGFRSNFGAGEYLDCRKARRKLEKAAFGNLSSGQNVPQGGEVISRGVNMAGAASDIQNNGFDVWVMIVPDGYFDHHGKNATGLYPGKQSWAVCAVDEDGQDSMGETVGTIAQEIGHYFKDDPYRDPETNPDGAGFYPLAQRDDKGVDEPGGEVLTAGGGYDTDHARHTDSSLIDGGLPDSPGIRSTGYDLTDGEFRTVNGFSFSGTDFTPTKPSIVHNHGRLERMHSFMSYSNEDTWTDSRISRIAIDTDYNRDSWGNPEPLLAGSGQVQDDGSLQIEDIDAYEGRRLLDSPGEAGAAEGEGTPVEVSLVTPEDEETASKVVTDRHHVELHVEETVEMVDFMIEFPMDTATATLRGDSFDAELNPITSVLRSVLDRIPEAGFAGDGAKIQAEATDYIETVANQMAKEQFADAKSTLQEKFMPIARQKVRAEYDAFTGQPTSGVVVEYTERMSKRLEVLSGETDAEDDESTESDEPLQPSDVTGTVESSVPKLEVVGHELISVDPQLRIAVELRNAGEEENIALAHHIFDGKIFDADGNEILLDEPGTRGPENLTDPGDTGVVEVFLYPEQGTTPASYEITVSCGEIAYYGFSYCESE